jgi:diacylglycerol kinase
MDAHKFFRSFLYALRGIGTMFRNEFNARVHFAAALAALVLGAVFNVSGLNG